MGAARARRRSEVRAIRSDLPAFPYAEYARLLGLVGIRVDRPDAIGPAWEAALAADRPTVLEMVTDPTVPPVPPHVTAKQIEGLRAGAGQGRPGRDRGGDRVGQGMVGVDVPAERAQ